MSGDLFDVPVQKSPRLKWMERHGLRTRHYPDRVEGEEDPDTGRELHVWVAWQNELPYRVHGGPTENDALAAWAKARGVRLWNEEGA